MSNARNIETNLSSCRDALARVKNYLQPGEGRIDSLMRGARESVRGGADKNTLLPPVFAAVYMAVEQTLGITPHDVQLLAAISMARGHVIELPTGEGKTLAAVFTATLGAVYGRGVHVLTFNDYLARRDALWMGPVYERLGLRASFIHETMEPYIRKRAYAADVTYVTAKEAGFDYLRGFLAYDTDSLVQRPFEMAIIDEADSILIDEARIPLVIAGDLPMRVQLEEELLAAVSRLQKDTHFATDEYANHIALTEDGIDFLEKTMRIENLYAEENHDLLTRVHVLLQALFMLRRDVDYIVRGDEVLLVDEFTGRVVKNREWPDGLQAAVELKEGLTPRAHGIVMNRVTLRDFLQFYPHLCGMTGTAAASAAEFGEFYNKTVTIIPSHTPCIRADHPDNVYLDRAAKERALVDEITRVHATGRPILIGTATVMESEELAALLRPTVPGLAVLNAKNDEKEAEIIAGAGRLGAVTISTNMAGRGVDIRLGGTDDAESEQVRALGGLYVIGTNRFESVRIDNQLRGRAGRQGDPGDSRFFISLEDDLMVKYRLSESLPSRLRASSTDGLIRNGAVGRAIVHTQRVSEGQILDAKITLAKYSSVVEDQRKLVHRRRMDILAGSGSLSLLEKEAPEEYEKLLEQVPREEFCRAQRQIELFAINQCWADHLLSIEGFLDEVQIISQVREDPFGNYNRRLIEAFETLEEHIRERVLELFSHVVVTDGKIDLTRMGVRGPSSTRTYMVNDGTEQLGLINGIGAVSNPLSAPLYGFYMMAEYMKKRRGGKES